MGYQVTLIGIEEAGEIYRSCKNLRFNTAKADISGICVKVHSEDREIIDMWRDNFRPMNDEIRTHARIFCLKDDQGDRRVLYNRVTSTVFLYNFDYYGWIKSMALAMASDILEDSHKIYSVHGAALDIDGVGVTLIAPSKTGKTTQSWGLLRAKNAHLITDDWYFVRLGSGRPQATGSEKNCYIDADIGDVWEEYKPLVKNVKFDNKGRGIANVRWVTGESSVSQGCSLRYVILLQRNTFEKEVVQKIDSHRALEYLMSADLCNPHQIVRDPFRSTLRANFFKKLFEQCEVYMVNTTGTPQETQAAIRKIVGVE